MSNSVPLAVVDQRRSANARRIQRMGGVVVEDVQRIEVTMPEDDVNEDRVLRDASGQIVRVL